MAIGGMRPANNFQSDSKQIFIHQIEAGKRLVYFESVF